MRIVEGADVVSAQMGQIVSALVVLPQVRLVPETLIVEGVSVASALTGQIVSVLAVLLQTRPAIVMLESVLAMQSVPNRVRSVNGDRLVRVSADKLNVAPIESAVRQIVVLAVVSVLKPKRVLWDGKRLSRVEHVRISLNAIPRANPILPQVMTSHAVN
jgi:hypothetical protein